MPMSQQPKFAQKISRKEGGFRETLWQEEK
jgi:hypothetical protein